MSTGLFTSSGRHNLRRDSPKSLRRLLVGRSCSSALRSSPRPQICKAPLVHISLLNSEKLAHSTTTVRAFSHRSTGVTYVPTYVSSTISTSRRPLRLSLSYPFRNHIFSSRANATTMASPIVSEAHANQRHAPVERITDRLETPSLDDRSYRVVKLSNQLEVLLVHDAETDKASAAMDVNVGNFSDRADLPGMAHAVEHLLFMGTKKYPKENEYSQYLSSHSGNSNAYTAATSTNYFFEVGAQASEDATEAPLYGALDRFAQFFIEPLFLSETLDRELRAVDSENKKNLQSDTWRLHQLDKSLTNPNHPFCHFSTGNFEVLKTLPEARGLDVRKEFMDFHAAHYSANVMKLVVLGREPLDTLEAWVAELFAGVQNKNLPRKVWDGEQPLGEKELLTQCFARPVMDARSLDLTFPFMDQEELYDVQPGRYISHLIGHEGPGSIMAYIKSKGWANGLSAGAYGPCPGTAFFSVSIRLTEDGLKNYQEIIKIIFEYISMLKESPPQSWIFDEQKGMMDVDFKFKQKSRAGNFTTKTASFMQKPIPREWLLSGQSRIRRFDASVIEKALSYLRADNFRFTVVSQTFPGGWDSKEKWYGTEYKYEKIPLGFLEEIKKASHVTTAERIPDLHLPHKNEFIPTKLEVEKKDVKTPAIAPKLIRHDELARAWFKKDDAFWVPKANVYITLKNPLPSATAENSIKSRIYAELVRDNLEEFSYDAELAGLQYSVTSHSQGLQVELAGYNDKIPVLLEKVLTTMRDLEVKEDRFGVIQEKMLRGIKNWGFQQPYNQVGEYTRWLTSEKGFINDQFIDELPRLTAKDIQIFYPLLLSQMHIETFTHGNMYKEDALRLTKLVETTLKPRALTQTQWPIRRSLIFPPGSNYVYHKTLVDPKNVNHCIEILLHVGDKSDRELRARLLLLAQMTEEPAFDQLRTKEQLGYVVFTGARLTSTTMGYRVIIQSERTAPYLESRVNAFFDQYAKSMAELSEADFEGHKRSLITKRLEKLKNLDQESARHWTHIDSEYFDFELVHHDAAHIKQLTKKDITEFFNHYISPASPHRSQLATHLIAQGKASVPPSAEKNAQITELLSKALKTAGVEPQSDVFQTRLLAAGSEEADVLDAVQLHLTDDLKLPADKSTAIIADGMKVLSITSEANVAKKEAIVIDNIRSFKAGLAATAGARPVKDLSEFEDLDSKL